MKLIELKEKKLADLKEIAKTLKIEKLSSMSKDDLVDAITKLKDKIPLKNKNLKFDSISNIAPFRIVNIGNNKTEGLMYFIKIIEKKLNKKAKIKFMDLQQGDVSKTLSDVSLLEKLIGPRLKTNIDIGVGKFIDWYIEYYRVKRHVKK